MFFHLRRMTFLEVLENEPSVLLDRLMTSLGILPPNEHHLLMC
jgi:hypothetical protein